MASLNIFTSSPVILLRILWDQSHTCCRNDSIVYGRCRCSRSVDLCLCFPKSAAKRTGCKCIKVITKGKYALNFSAFRFSSPPLFKSGRFLALVQLFPAEPRVTLIYRLISTDEEPDTQRTNGTIPHRCKITQKFNSTRVTYSVVPLNVF